MATEPLHALRHPFAGIVACRHVDMLSCGLAQQAGGSSRAPDGTAVSVNTGCFRSSAFRGGIGVNGMEHLRQPPGRPGAALEGYAAEMGNRESAVKPSSLHRRNPFSAKRGRCRTGRRVRPGGNHHRGTGAGLLGPAGSTRGGVRSRPECRRAAITPERPRMQLQLRPVKESGEWRWGRWPSCGRAVLYSATERELPERVRGCPDAGSEAGERLPAAWACRQRVTPILPSSRRRNAVRRRMLRRTAATPRRQSTWAAPSTSLCLCRERLRSPSICESFLSL